MPAPDDAAAVRGAAKDYYRAMVAADAAALRRLFDPRASIIGHFEGAFLWLDLESFIAEAESLVGKHGQEECRVESVTVGGDIAVAVAAGRYAGLWFLDHLSMVRVEGAWRIVAKTFDVVPDP